MPANHAELAEPLRELSEQIRVLQAEARALETERQALIRQALGAGWSLARIAGVTGLSPGRVSQLK